MMSPNTEKESKVQLSLIKHKFDYDPDVGVLTWKNPGANSKSKIGKPAGYYGETYIKIPVGRTVFVAHRLIWFYVYGVWPIGQLDHINGDTKDNRICNLREVDTIENSKNQKLASNNSTGCVGVYWNKKSSKWSVSISVDGEPKYLGLFETRDEAITIRKQAEIKYGYHENHGRNML